MLKTELRTMEDSAALRDALDACVFFSTSMGRLGADFTAQLPALFEDKMHSLVVHFWKEGVTQLQETLKICREAGVAGPLSSSSSFVSAGSEASGNDMEGGGGPMPPPRRLMALPPLGRLVNAFLTGINELRRCLLPGIFVPLRASMESTLVQVEELLKSNERAVMTPGLRGDATELRAKAKEMRQVMTDIVIPYVKGALEFGLGNEDGANQYHGALAKVLNPPEPEPTPEEEPKDEEENVAAEAPTPEGEVSGQREAEEVNTAPNDTPEEPQEAEGWDNALDEMEIPEN